MKFPRLACAALLVALSGPVAAQQTMVIATNPQGTSFFSAGAAIAKLMSEAGMQAIVRPTAGASQNVPALNNGDIDFVVCNVVDTGAAYTGTGDWQGATT